MMNDMLNPEIEDLNRKAEQYCQLLSNVHNEISKVIVGQDKIIVKLILALLSKGHVLLEGVINALLTIFYQEKDNELLRVHACHGLAKVINPEVDYQNALIPIL